MRHRIADRDLEYTWFPGAPHAVSPRGNGTPRRPFADAAGVHRLSWEIAVPATANNTQADWSASYPQEVVPGETLLPLFLWDRPINDPPSPQLTRSNLAIQDLRVWGGGAVTNGGQPLSAGAGTVEYTFRAKPNIEGDPNQFDLVWRFKGGILNLFPWARYDGNNFTVLPYLLGEVGKGLYFEVRNLTGAALSAGRLRVTCLAFEL